MRWDNLRLAEPERDGRLSVPLFEQGATVRTFDTPEFRGITFYEIRAKSIINRVPEVSRVPFRWTINPYRGCSHACFYCSWGETPILMSDGRTKPLSDVRPGDKVYGTVRQGVYRRYVLTDVLDHWSTVKRAYRVVLEDGTQLITSGDHRLLTNRGWKFVTAAVRPDQRPYLTANNKLIGTGKFAEPPKQSDDYRRGYLCGVVRGDGYLASRPYFTSKGRYWIVHQFRLAMVDSQPLQRTRRYLADMGIPTTEFVFQPGSAVRQVIGAIRTQSREHVISIEEIIAWPTEPSDDWCKGFLAGIFDAEGCYSRGVLRVSNSDEAILHHLRSSLKRFGFSFVVEGPRVPANKPVSSVRLLGGLRECLRLFHTVDPAITRKRAIEGVALKSDAPLRVISIEDLGMELPMYDLTTGTGDFIANGVVSHNCFARNTHTYLDLDFGQDFNSKIVVKVNAEQLLRKELTAKSWKGEHIAMGTNVDPYQRAEGRYKLMRGILAALRDAANPFSILTKGSLILRDVDLLQQCSQVAAVGTNVSVGFVDRTLWRSLEPGTPSPQTRMEVCRRLSDAGIACGVLMAPIIPFLSDSPSQLEATVRAIAECGADHVSPIVLHLRTGAREWFMQWLAANHPDLVERYERLYGRSAYAPKAYQEEISGRVHELAERYAVGDRGPKDARRIRHDATPAASPSVEQLSLI